jgi:hypothetical protein
MKNYHEKNRGRHVTEGTVGSKSVGKRFCIIFLKVKIWISSQPEVTASLGSLAEMQNLNPSSPDL